MNRPLLSLEDKCNVLYVIGFDDFLEIFSCGVFFLKCMDWLSALEILWAIKEAFC